MKKFLTLMITIMALYSCSNDNDNITTETETPVSQDSDFVNQVNDGKFDNSKLGLYKGIFTTNDASIRATIRIENDGKNLPIAIVTTQDGKTIELTANGKTSKGKESDNLTFSSDEMSFDLVVDENGENPRADNVTYNGNEGDIMMAKQTSKAPLETVTGTYQCVDCDPSHPELGKGGIQTFNFMFQGVGENATIATQATLNNRTYGTESGSALQSGCSEDGNFTTCTIRGNAEGDNGENFSFFGASGPVYLTGTHTYNNQSTGDQDCSTVRGTFIYESTRYGTSELSFQSDASTNCELPGPQNLIFEDFEDMEVNYIQTNRDDQVVADDISELDQNDYYGILINQNPQNVTYNRGNLGDGYYGAQDTNGASIPVNRIRLTYSNVDVTNFTLLDFSMFFATDDDDQIEGDWDQDARAGVEYSIDGGENWIKILAVEAGPGDENNDQNTDFVYEDKDFDGIGDVDGVRIDDRFRQLSRTLALPNGQTSIDIRVYIRVLNSDQEDIGIDNFEVNAQ